MTIKFFSIIITCCAIVGCVSPPEYPIEPVLSIGTNALSKNTVDQDGFVAPRDSLSITVAFTDGDGDIGFLKSDSTLYVIDTRDNSRVNDVRGLHYVPEQGAGNGISGEITMRLFGSCCGIKVVQVPCSPAPGKSDQVIYEIYIKDRAGHESNHVKTPPITIVCK